MAETGRRVVFPRKNAVEIEKFEVPELKDGQVLVETRASLISTGTELAYLQGITKPIQMGEHKYPIVPGYSAAGVITAVGKGVTNLKKGDRVCGGNRHGTRLIVEAAEAVRLPDNVSFEEATFHALGATSMNGIRLSRLVLGETVVVFGMGIVGQLALQIAKAAGAAKLIGVDLSDKRLEMAKRVGATVTAKPDEAALEALVKDLTGGEMAEVVVEATGNPKVFPLALKLAAQLGRVIALGSPRGNTPELDLYTELHCRGIQLIGAHAAMHPLVATPYNRWTRPRNRELFLDLISRGQLQTKPMITHRMPFAKAVDGYDLLVKDRTQAVGVILEYDGSL